jgi:hypothetical protein
MPKSIGGVSIGGVSIGGVSIGGVHSYDTGATTGGGTAYRPTRM